MRLIVYVETDLLGGAEIVTGHLIEALRPDIDVVALGPHREVVEYLAGRRPGTEAIVMPPMRSTRELRAFPTHRRILRSLAPAVFQAVLTFPTACQWPLIAASNVHGIVPIGVEHLGPLPGTRRGEAARRRLTRTLAAHVAVSNALARAVERSSKLPPGSVITIPNAVPDVPVHAVDLGVRRPVFGAAGRFEAGKGIDVLVRAVAMTPDVNLVLVGKGECERALRSLVDELGVAERVHFVGWTDDARSFVAAFDVLVVPSRIEAFGLVALEAMLAARPVIASAVGGLPEVVEDSRTGLLVPPDDPEALASALGALVADGPRRARMGRQGRDRALEHFSLRAMAQAYEALYDRVADQPPT